MSRSDWVRVGATAVLIFAVCAGFVWWGLVYKQEQAHQRQHTAAYTPDPSQKEARDACYGVQGLVEYSGCIAEKQKAQRDEQRAQFDLQAQQDMALWAFCLFVSGIVSLGITGGALYYVIQTFKATRASVDAANRSAEAAVRSSDAAEKALVAAHRPWVKAQISVGGPIYYNVNGMNFTFRFVLANIGNSPATNVWIHLNIVAPAIGTDIVFEDVRSQLRQLISGLKARGPSQLGFALFPGDRVEQEISVHISKEELKRLTEKVPFVAPTLIGAVDYRSGFSDGTHNTGFIVEVRTGEANKAISPKDGDVPAAEVRLVRSILEGGYAD